MIVKRKLCEDLLCLLGRSRVNTQRYSLVGSGIEAFFARKAVHATDDPAVHHCPVHITDLPPHAPVFHLQETFGNGDPFTVRVSGSDPHIFHLHVQSLPNTKHIT